MTFGDLIDVGKTVIEYKIYNRKNDAERELSNNPAIIHYKDANVEWWSDFDALDNEIHFRCSNGFERWVIWKYSAEYKRYVVDTYKDTCGNITEDGTNWRRE